MQLLNLQETFRRVSALGCTRVACNSPLLDYPIKLTIIYNWPIFHVAISAEVAGYFLQRDPGICRIIGDASYVELRHPLWFKHVCFCTGILCSCEHIVCAPCKTEIYIVFLSGAGMCSPRPNLRALYPATLLLFVVNVKQEFAFQIVSNPQGIQWVHCIVHSSLQMKCEEEMQPMQGFNQGGVNNWAGQYCAKYSWTCIPYCVLHL